MPRTSTSGQGRPRGVRNHATQGLSVRAKLEAAGHDPIDWLVKQARNEKNPLELRVRVNLELVNYIHPRLKAVEHSVASSKAGTTSLWAALQRLEEERAKAPDPPASVQ